MTINFPKETPVQIPGPAGLLEGRLANDSQGSGCGLIALHPHPSYGGNMHNNVVAAIARASVSSAFTTLRFNFRGVMASEGSYADGLGEQDDLGAAIGFLRREAGVQTIVAAGYSFGACIGLAYCHRPEHDVDHLVLVSPPPFLLSPELSLTAPVVRKIIVGDRDDIAPADAIQSKVPAEKKQKLVTVIPEADHFFLGKEEQLESLLRSSLEEIDC